jgi:hypothetical protein
MFNVIYLDFAQYPCSLYCEMTPESRNSGARVDVHYRQRLGKHVPAATNKQATIEVLLGYNDGNGVFCWFCPKAI